MAFSGCGISNSAKVPEKPSTELRKLERRVHQMVNNYRLSKKLPPLTTNEIIAQQARSHSDALARKRLPFGHDGFDKRVKRISNFLHYTVAAENVAYNKGYTDSAKNAVQCWLRSATHRENIKGNYKLTGIGVARNAQGIYYFTQIFWR
jgi:uncharacterized protein YkwD